MFPRFGQLGVRVDVRPVSSAEEVLINGREYQATYREEKLQRVEKGIDHGSSMPGVREIPVGSGKILWMPLPLEAADNTAPLEALYRFALQKAGVASHYFREVPDPSVLIRPVVFPNSTMYTIVNESSQDKKVRFTDTTTRKKMEVDVKAGRSAMVFVGRQ